MRCTGEGARHCQCLYCLSQVCASVRGILIELISHLRMQSPRALDLVASGQAVAGPPTPDSVRPRLALPGDGYGAELPRALSTPHQVRSLKRSA